ncbi:DUF2235 domain-containing protein [Pseudohalocynthiibacter aestuariivivens]|nr:DUF2235 domain-containing protein [Pseudohalocynthiibacter aestuariivivens]QIE45364.1 DUF2235 domain-containing protein [Pseudohalocynthiibacter aestuariivivens]
MSWRRWAKAITEIFLPGIRRGQSVHGVRTRGSVTHVLILDGTMSSLSPGSESNAGLAYRLIAEQAGPAVSVFYEAGLQWQDWRSGAGVMMGRGINRQIRRAYGYLASRYCTGDQIILLGYSRGAYAVRSLAGAIERVGLLKAEHATERNVRLAYRHYESHNVGPAVEAFRTAYCHEATPIAMVGVWDTVKALGLHVPVLWRLTAHRYAFHSDALGASVLHGYHALALDETRRAFAPVMWDSRAAPQTQVTQMWFRGAHGDIGGQLGGFDAARGLSNIPLVWMLERAEEAGLLLPEDWQARFPCDPDAPSVGTWRGWGKLFLLRSRRRIGADPSERLHPTAGVRDLPLAVASHTVRGGQV